MRKQERYVKGAFDYYGNEVEGYEIYVEKRYLGFVAKFESATRSYWSVIDTHEGCVDGRVKLKGKPYEYGSYDSWDKTRGGIVHAIFPLELGADPHWINMEAYSWV